MFTNGIAFLYPLILGLFSLYLITKGFLILWRYVAIKKRGIATSATLLCYNGRFQHRPAFSFQLEDGQKMTRTYMIRKTSRALSPKGFVFTLGAQVPIWYDPQNPRNIWMQGDWMLPLYGALCIVLGVVLILLQIFLAR